jgi:hypothetical protein
LEIGVPDDAGEHPIAQPQQQRSGPFGEVLGAAGIGSAPKFCRRIDGSASHAAESSGRESVT